MKIDKLEIKIYNTRSEMGIGAATDIEKKISALLKEKQEINIIFAAAPSQNEVLSALTECKIDWHRINAFHMDEYIGLAKDSKQRFGKFLSDNLFSKVNFKSVNYINGCLEEVENECERYASLIKNFNPDIVIMGIGENGHIAFNDPHVADFSDAKMVKVVELDEMCRNQQVNDKCFESIDLVPKRAITLTIPTLISAPNVFCIVPSKNKAQAVKNTVYGEISEKCPASILRLKENAILYLDKDSSAFL